MGDVAATSGGTLFCTDVVTSRTFPSTDPEHSTLRSATIGTVIRHPRTRVSPLPLTPLLTAFQAAPRPSVVRPAWDAIRTAPATWLNAGFLDAATDPELFTAVAVFHATIHPLPLHQPWIDRRGRFL